MNRLLVPLGLLAAGLALAGDPKDDLQAALAKLTAADNYAWKTTTEIEGAPFSPGPQSGRADKEGWILVSTETDGSTIKAVLKGTNGVVQTKEGWKTAEELPRPQFGRGGPPDMSAFAGRMLLGVKAPAEEAAVLMGKVKELKATGPMIAGELTAEGAKEFASMRRGRRGGGGGPPEPKDAKGDVRFWVKDGVLQKYILHVESTMTFPGNGQEMNIGRTVTVEFSDLGAAKVEIPEDARKKLAAQ